jgi:hypothetical protein
MDAHTLISHQVDYAMDDWSLISYVSPTESFAFVNHLSLLLTNFCFFQNVT